MFVCMYVYPQPALVSKPLNPLGTKFHQTCIMDQHMGARNHFENVENQPLFWSKTLNQLLI